MMRKNDETSPSSLQLLQCSEVAVTPLTSKLCYSSSQSCCVLLVQHRLEPGDFQECFSFHTETM